MRGIDQKLTTTGECIGTPSYMSPEPVQGGTLDHRTDIYSLGIIAYELATGCVPFQNHSWYGLVNKIVHQPIPDLSTNCVNLPPWFQEVVTRATAKQKEDRFQSANEMSQAIGVSGKGVEFSFRGTSTAYLAPASAMLKKPGPQLPVVMIALLCFVLIALGAVGMSIFSHTDASLPTPSALQPMPRESGLDVQDVPQGQRTWEERRPHREPMPYPENRDGPEAPFYGERPHEPRQMNRPNEPQDGQLAPGQQRPPLPREMLRDRFQNHVSLEPRPRFPLPPEGSRR